MRIEFKDKTKELSLTIMDNCIVWIGIDMTGDVKVSSGAFDLEGNEDLQQFIKEMAEK